MFRSYRQSTSSKIRNLKHNYIYIYIDMFRNLRHLTNFYKLFKNIRSSKLYISNTSHIYVYLTFECIYLWFVKMFSVGFLKLLKFCWFFYIRLI